MYVRLRLKWLPGMLLLSIFAAGCQPPNTTDAEILPAASLTASADLGVSPFGVRRVEVDGVELAFEGREFGDVGQYEWVDGRLFAELDPADPHNAIIVNLDKAPLNAEGRVEYSVEFRLLKPVEMRRGNGAIFADIPNRGTPRAFTLSHDGLADANFRAVPRTPADIGDGFLLRLGYTLLWSGWQVGVAPESIGAEFPVAKNADGSPIQGWITTELRGSSRSLTIGTGLYPTVAQSMPQAQLYRRAKPHSDPELLPRDTWSFASCTSEADPAPSNVDICLEGGFSADASYFLVHEVQDPIVTGLGFAAVRDATSFFRYDTSQDNPLVSRFGGSGEPRNVIGTVLAYGRSQPGRFLRDFIYQGFNRDSAGRRAFDGAIPVGAGARRTFTNYPFGDPGRFVRAVNDHYSPGDEFPFTYATILDPVSGRVDGILARCSLTGTCPKIMQFDSANELWSARGSLLTTDPLGRQDVPIPDNVRIYQHASTEHNPLLRDAGECKYLTNPASFRENHRALVVAMHEWVTTGGEPPPSQYSRIADGTLVSPLPHIGFPSIPGVSYLGKANDFFLNDYGATPVRHTTAGYTVLVPRVDADGNDLAGVRSTDIRVPLATYTGWNYRKAGHVEDEGCATYGSHFPFATTAAQRGDDPRLSVEERYGSHAGYVEKVREAVKLQQDARLLLSEDAEFLIRNAEQRDIGLPRF